jgi:hypothetical protein
VAAGVDGANSDDADEEAACDGGVNAVDPLLFVAPRDSLGGVMFMVCGLGYGMLWVP